MPLTHFLGLIAMVIVAGGVTVFVAMWSGFPLLGLSFAAVAASLILTWTRVGR